MSSDSGDKKARRKGSKSADSTQELPLGWPTAQFQRTQMGVDSNLSIEVISASSELAAAVEEAAIFYANAQSAEAKGSLARAVQKENLAPAAERLWLMLLDLHRELGEREEFDARALEYANRFQCQRPQFELEAVPAAPEALRAPREIVGHSKAFLGVIEEAGASRTRVQVDCTELKRVDFVSAAALLNIAAELNRDGKRLELENVNELIAALFEVMGVAALAKVTTRH
ncbi:MAG TPA: STAS domain-containing protein [Burkholderiales bacterium]|nr:STAS domain-containing protein [Burkholderiales bacterium]